MQLECLVELRVVIIFASIVGTTRASPILQLGFYMLCSFSSVQKRDTTLSGWPLPQHLSTLLL